jgi:pectin lyase
MRKMERCRRSAWAALIALSALLAACGGGSDDDSTEDSTSISSEVDAAGTNDAEAAVAVADAGAQSPEEEREQAASIMPVSQKAVGFAAGVTGGGGGKVVRVTNAKDLAYELCHSGNGDICTDHEPRVIEVASTIDMRDFQGYAYAKGCYAYQQCKAPHKTEVMLLVSKSEEYRCVGKPGEGQYRYSVAGLKGMPVGSNKTLIGIGKNARILGKGLLIKNGVSNIIIRNVAFTDINQGLVFGGDAITILDATKIWIDHNYFARIAREMIVTGDGMGKAIATDVTISNNEFDGRNEYSPDCSGKNYWGLLLAGTDRLTFAGNWLHDIGGRWPKLHATRDSVVHMANNLFENSSGNGHALQYSGSKLRILAEGNYFDDVAYPVAAPGGDRGQLFGLYRQSNALRNVCSSAIGRICTGNVADPAPKTDHLVQDSAAINALKPYRSSLVKAYSASSVPDTVRANAGVGKLK